MTTADVILDTLREIDKQADRIRDAHLSNNKGRGILANRIIDLAEQVRRDTKQLLTQENYNGWRNHATWNIALWLQSDEGLYNFAKEMPDYVTLRDTLREVGTLETPDRVAYNDSALDIEALDEVIRDIKSK